MEEVEELRAACLVAKEETAAVRVKLRNAVTKGKAIDEERRALQARLTAVMEAGAAQDRAAGEERAALAARVQELEGQLAAQGPGTGPPQRCKPPSRSTERS